MEEDDDLNHFGPNVSDIPSLVTTEKRQIEVLSLSPEGDNKVISNTLLSEGQSKNDDKDNDVIESNVLSPLSQFALSETNEDFDNHSGMEYKHQRSQIPFMDRTSTKEHRKQKPIGMDHVTNERSHSGEQLGDQVSENVNFTFEPEIPGIYVKSISSSGETVGENERDDCDLENEIFIKNAERMTKDEKQFPDCSFSKSNRKVILLKRAASINQNEVSENDCFCTKIETSLSNEHLIKQLRIFCDLTSTASPDSSLSVHHQRMEGSDVEPLHGKEVEILTKKSCTREHFPRIDDSSSSTFDIKQKGSFSCWICLKEFTYCLDVKKHIIKNHSQGLCGYAQWENKKSELLSQLLLFCPNKCNYASTHLYHFSYHMVTCQNPTLFPKQKYLIEVQRDFISNRYFKLQAKEHSSITAIPSKLKASEFPLEHDGEDVLEELDSHENPDHQKEYNAGSQREQIKQTAGQCIETTSQHELRSVGTDGNDIYECDACYLAFSTNQLLERHKKNCMVGKISGNSLDVKLEEQNEETSFLCTDYGNVFNPKKVSGKAEPFKCNECSETFTNLSSLEIHMIVHGREKPFKCSECGKTFRNEGCLASHLRGHWEDKSFKCDECNMTFGNKKNLRTHMKEHNPFKCDECGKSFSQTIALQKHILGKHNKERQFKCTECSKSYKHKTTLQDHMKIHSGVINYSCELCGKGFGLKNSLRRHLRTQHAEIYYNNKKFSKHRAKLNDKILPGFSYKSEKIFQDDDALKNNMNNIEGKTFFNCKECEKNFETSTDFMEHSCMQTTLKPFQCNECKKKFMTLRSFKMHRVIHGEKNFECNECGKRFFRKPALQEHYRTHSGEKPFKCTLCDKSFSNRRILKVHMKRHSDKKPFLCNECGKTFSVSSGLRAHMKVHSGIKPFQCTVCNYRCRDGGNLKKHMLKHTGEKPYQCKICGIRLKCGTGHMRIHLGEKPHECKECGTRFRAKSTLTSHMRIHTGERPYQCTECGKRFSRSSTFRSHMMRHRGEKPHTCPFCSKGFVHKSHLTSHIRVHTGEKPYKCDVCDMRFNQNVSRRMHMKKHTEKEQHSMRDANQYAHTNYTFYTQKSHQYPQYT